ncbi:hypothetical protein BpHYR1_021767 [Brachionus plicatilis]|uniref:Uncharacterized protein n=1 Tax=Brachionus plicatilis TaxID=10195 RepID=A0A3M7QXR0_BRAPC|nr:hypothetical protein BpHYR1_021767 [Brachionus plicatilis]
MRLITDWTGNNILGIRLFELLEGLLKIKTLRVIFDIFKEYVSNITIRNEVFEIGKIKTQKGEQTKNGEQTVIKKTEIKFYNESMRANICILQSFEKKKISANIKENKD